MSSGPAERDPPAGRASGGRGWAVRAVKLLLTVLVTAFILQRVGLTYDEIRALDPVVWRPRGPLLVLASLLLLAAYLLSALLWNGLVRELGGGRLSVWRSFRIYFTANLGRYVPGKVLQIAGVAILARRAGVEAPPAVAAALMGQGFTLLGAGLVGLMAFRHLGGGPDWPAGFLGPWGVLALAILAVLVVIVSLPSVLGSLLRLGGRLVPPGSLAELRLGAGFGPRWISLYVLLWALHAVAFWVLVRSVGAEGELLEVGPAFAAAYLLGYVAVFAPAGIGVREGFLVALLEPVTGAAAGLALAVIARFWTTVVELAPAIGFAALELRGGREGAPHA